MSVEAPAPEEPPEELPGDNEVDIEGWLDELDAIVMDFIEDVIEGDY